MSGHLLKTFKSQELAREKNKFEQRKLNIDLHGKNGPEAVYKFNLDRLNKEQRLVARDLGRITRGAPKRVASSLTLSIERDKEQRLIDQQLQRIRQGVHRQPGMSASLLAHDRKFSQPELTFQSHNSEDIGIKESTFSKPLSERNLNDECTDIDNKSLDGFMIIQLLTSSASTQNADKGRQHAHTSVGERKFKNQSVNQSITSNVIDPVPIKRSNEIRNIESSQANQEHTDRKLDNINSDKQTHSSPRPTNQQSESVPLSAQPAEQDIAPVSSQVPSLDLASLANLDMSNIRGNINRRLSKGGAYSERTPRKTGSEVVSETRHRTSTSDTRLPDADSGTKASGSGGYKVADTKPMETEVPIRKPSKSVDDILKKSIYDPEYYNPDGSVKTMHNLPTFDEAWQQAEKARYIRTKDPRETDRELSTREIFAKH